ncbi:MAG: hypothetical protein R2786_00295 [Flavobacteriaceae bacterium]
MMPSVKKGSTSKVEGLSKREEKKRINIRWNSGLFFQIGLIISMLLVFLIVESNFGIGEADFQLPKERELKEIALKNYVVEVIPEKKVVVKEVVKKREPQKPIVSNKFKEMDNTTVEKESQTAPTEVDPNTPIKNTVPALSEAEKPSKTTLMMVQNAPIFPGCESLSTEKERRACLDEKINTFIGRKFNTDKFSEKYAGKNNRIDVQFTVDSKGEIVDIKARSAYEDLGLEAKRVIGSLPKLTPGKHNDQWVEVVYTVPISLNIEY